MEYKWRRERTDKIEPMFYDVLDLGSDLRLEIHQTQLRSEKSDRAYSARLFQMRKDERGTNWQSCLWNNDNIPETVCPSVRSYALNEALDYIQSEIDKLTPTRDALRAAANQL